MTDQTRKFFGRHAGDYSRNPSHARGEDLRQLLAVLAPQADWRTLDLATGTGHTALALAPHVAHVVGLDLTPEMLLEAQRLGDAREIVNVTWILGDAAEPPLSPGSLDAITCRRAAHHFPAPEKVFERAFELLRPGGRLGLVDMCPPEEAASFWNRLERARDASHREAYPASAWHALLTSLGFVIESSRVLPERVGFSTWLRPKKPEDPPGRQARAVLRQAIPAEEAAIGWDATTDSFVKRRLVLVARRPSG